MPLDGLIPIGGASGGNSGSKRGGSSDLTGGLISLSGTRDNVDVDMSDFDVGDLLGDDSSKTKSKTSSKTTSDDKKKKKSKEKGKSKKSKSKTKKSAFDDDDDYGNDDGNDWTSSAKNWDSAAELEMAAAAARRKNGGGGLDGEFAKMLGLDSGDIGGGDFGSVGSPPLSPEPIVNRDDKQESDDPFGISSYTPTVRGSKKYESTDVMNVVEESTKGESGGLSASFFQSDDKDDQDSSSLSSFLGPSSERRGGTRGGRRQAGSAESDPFGFGSTTTSSSNFDSLFGGSSSRRGALDDPFAKPAQEPLDDSDSRQHSTKDPIEERKVEKTRDEPHSGRDIAPASKRLSAKDDLLADLFSSEPRSSSRSDRRQPESSFSKVDEESDNDYEKKTKVEMAPESTPTTLAVDPAKQQNDLLAELFDTPYSSKAVSYDRPKEELQEQEQEVKPLVVEVKSVTPPREKSPSPKKAESPVYSDLPSRNTSVDLASARDSLLMDLLGDQSPPKPVLSRRRSRSSNNSPDKEVIKTEDPFKSSLPPSPIQSQPLATVPEASAEISPVLSATNEKPDTPPSPGRRRTIALDKGALTIRESDFEQSKDSLLEEILPSSPSISVRSSPHRRNSYSQSFDVEDSFVAEANEEYVSEVVEERNPNTQEEPPASESPVPTSTVVKTTSPPQPELKAESAIRSSLKPKPPQHQPDKTNDIREEKVVVVSVCNCEEREAKLAAAFEVERAVLQQKLDELTQQLDDQAASSTQLTQQLTQQIEEHEASSNQLSQQLEARLAANAQLAQQLAAAERDKLRADQLAATSKDDAANYQHRAELLEAELRSLREELSRSKRAVQDAELALARKTAEQDEAEQLERHREKRALEALSAQMQRALARLTISHQVQEEGPGYDNSAARVAAEDEARLRVIASLEGSSKRAAQHAEQERVKLAELLRELEAGTRNARQGALEDKERLRQEQQRLDALSAHLQAQTAALRDQEAAHAAYMGRQLAEAREDARVYEARLTTRRTQLERDERALYEARAEFAAFREQTALEIEREHEELRASRLALEDAWRELRADRDGLEAELASHEDEFQALESMRQEVQEAEARLAERTQDVVALAEKLDAGTRDLLEREQIVAQQAAEVQGTDTSFANRERALERVKNELEAREQRLHVQIRQLDSARGRLTQQRREQQQLLTAARRQFLTAQQPAKVAVDNNKLWRRSDFTPADHHSTPSNNFNASSPVVDQLKAQPWEIGLHVEEDPSGLPPALRKQVEANWQRRNQQGGQRRQTSGLTFDLGDFDATRFPSSWSTKMKDVKTPTYISKSSNIDSSAKPISVSAQRQPLVSAHKNPDLSRATLQQRPSSTPLTTTNSATLNSGAQALPSSSRSQQPPPPPLKRPTGTFQPTLRVNL